MEQQLDKYGLPLLESMSIQGKEYVLVKTRPSLYQYILFALYRHRLK